MGLDLSKMLGVELLLDLAGGPAETLSGGGVFVMGKDMGVDGGAELCRKTLESRRHFWG